MLGIIPTTRLPTVFSFEESSRHRNELRHMTFAAIEPIVGLPKQSRPITTTCVTALVGLSAGAELDGSRSRLYPYELLAEARNPMQLSAGLFRPTA
jgi:hypothetical protein